MSKQDKRLVVRLVVFGLVGYLAAWMTHLQDRGLGFTHPGTDPLAVLVWVAVVGTLVLVTD